MAGADNHRLAVMKNSLKKLQDWRARRKLRSLQRWEQIRTKGKTRYVVHSTLTFVLTVVGVLDVTDHIFGDGQYSISVPYFIFYLVMGIYSAHDGWNTMEGKYQIALDDARAAASHGSALPPPNSPTQISESR